MRNLLLLIFFCCATCAVKAQQIQTSSFYDLQGMFQNPAMAGTGATNFIGATYQSQWNSIPGAPTTAYVFGSFNLPKKKIGIGGNIYSDKTGPTSRTGVVISLAKHIVMDNGDKFSLGIENKFQQYKVDVTKLATYGLDPAISGSGTKFNYDAGFGLAYVSKNWHLGASVSQLVQSGLDFSNGTMTKTEKARLYRHFYFHGSYKIQIDETTSITPNTVMTYLPNAPDDFQIGARIEHNNHFWYGAGYRVNQNFMLSAGVNINQKFVIGYAYDEYISPISYFNQGGTGHEILLRYNFGKK